MAGVVQFYGVDSVLQVYDARGVDTWAIFQGKTMTTRGQGRDELSEFLSMLSNGYGNSTYTLKIFEGITDSEVKDNTPADGSFSFALPSEGMTSGMGRMGGPGTADLYAKIAALEKKISGADQAETIGSTLIGLLKDPEQLVHLATAVNMFMGRAVPQMVAGHLPGISAANTGIDQPDRLQRLERALNTLERNDPQFLDHLEKLAHISETSKSTFQGLLVMLKNF